jgi:plastocyanin
MSSVFSTFSRLRLIPRLNDFLDRTVGTSGEIYFNAATNSLRVYSGKERGGFEIARTDLSNVSNGIFAAKAQAAGIGSSGSIVGYVVTVTGPQGGDIGNKYNLDGIYRAQPDLVVGNTYVFIQDDPTNVYFPNANDTIPNPHPLNFSADSINGELDGGTSYLDGVEYFLNGSIVTQTVYNSSAFNTATSRQVRITITSLTPSILYYWCYNHLAMGNSAAIVFPIPGSGGDFELKISSDDDIDRVITSGTTLKFTGSGGITTSSSSNGIVTFTNTSTFFNSIAVDGQSNITAQSQNSSLELIAGSNVFITTDPTNNSVLISAVAGEGSTANSFEVIEVPGQSNIIANTPSSVLTIEAGSNVSISTDPSARKLTISSSAASGVSDFRALNEAALTNLNIDDIYLPAITKLIVSNQGAQAYLFDQYTGNNPTIYAISGTTIAFKFLSRGHPFFIQTPAGQNFNDGLFHVDEVGQVATGSSAQGKDFGTLYWKVPASISGGYRYQCGPHAVMVGSITVKNIAVI